MPTASPPSPVDIVDQLRERIQTLHQGIPRAPLATHPALTELVRLHTGEVYAVDSAGLMLALLAGPSRAGAWSAVVGVADFGIEAAVELGVDLSRTLLVPEPGDSWLEVVAALVDVVSVVVVRPPSEVGARTAARLSARLRTRSTALVVWGSWPRCDVLLSRDDPRWEGVGRGHGHLRARRLTVTAHRGGAPPRRMTLWMPGATGQSGHQITTTRRLISPRS
jgi:hypothetical protein